MASNQKPAYNTRRASRKALKTLGITEKRPKAGHNVSHAMNKTKRVFKPNLQKAKVMVDGKLITLRLDTRTLRTLTKAVKEREAKAPQKRPTAKPPRTAARAK